MIEYVPMAGPLPGVQYTPSNGTEGEYFQEGWCCRCERDKEMNGTCDDEGRHATDEDWCPILGASYMDGAVEWRDLGERTVCLAFVEKGTPPESVRCEHTVDMFEAR